MAEGLHWICTYCGGKTTFADTMCKHCGEPRTADAQMINIGGNDPKLAIAILDPSNGYAQTGVTIQIPRGDGEYTLGRKHGHPDRSGIIVEPDVDLYDHLTPYINSAKEKQYCVSKLQAVIRRNGDDVTIERFRSDNALYNDAVPLRKVTVSATGLTVTNDLQPGSPVVLSPGTAWWAGVFSPEATIADRKSPGIAFMVIEEQPQP